MGKLGPRGGTLPNKEAMKREREARVRASRQVLVLTTFATSAVPHIIGQGSAHRMQLQRERAAEKGLEDQGFPGLATHGQFLGYPLLL